MKNFVGEGHSLDLVAGAGGVLAGTALLVAGLLVVPSTTTVEGSSFSGWLEGMYTLPSDTGTAWAVCDKLYWDAVNGRLTKTAAGNTKVGIAGAVKAAGDASGVVKLIPSI